MGTGAVSCLFRCAWSDVRVLHRKVDILACICLHKVGPGFGAYQHGEAILYLKYSQVSPVCFSSKQDTHGTHKTPSTPPVSAPDSC